MKKRPEISSFYAIVPKIMIIGYNFPEIWCITDVIIFQFGLFFTQTAGKFQKNGKSLRYHHFMQVNQNDVDRLYWS